MFASQAQPKVRILSNWQNNGVQDVEVRKSSRQRTPVETTQDSPAIIYDFRVMAVTRRRVPFRLTVTLDDVHPVGSWASNLRSLCEFVKGVANEVGALMNDIREIRSDRGKQEFTERLRREVVVSQLVDAGSAMINSTDFEIQVYTD